MHILALTNQKGGVGKTTTAVNLSAGLAYAGYPTLLVDMDSQGHAGKGLGVDVYTLDQTIADVLLTRRKKLRDIIVKTYIDGLDVAPSNIRLAVAAKDVSVGRIGKEQILSKALSSITNEYAYAIVDCPPSLDILTLNSLVAADYVIIPCQMTHYALEGIVDLADTIAEIRDELDRDLSILGAVATMYDARNKTANRMAMDQLMEYFKDKLFSTKIPVNTTLNLAQSVGKAIFDYDSECSGAIAYKTLTQEVIHRVQT